MSNVLASLAIVAHVKTVTCFERFSQELQLHHSSAEIGLLTILQHRVKSVQVLLLSNACASAAADKKVIKLPVAVVVVEDALSLLLVTARPSALLNVALQTFGH